jgi:hypothetical protein
MLFKEKIAVYTDNFIHSINTLSGRNANFLMLKWTCIQVFRDILAKFQEHALHVIWSKE